MSDIENTMPTEKEVREKVTAELEADFEKRVDQRIAGARKKWEKKRSREAAEALARIEKLKQIEEAGDFYLSLIYQPEGVVSISSPEIQRVSC